MSSIFYTFFFLVLISVALTPQNDQQLQHQQIQLAHQQQFQKTLLSNALDAKNDTIYVPSHSRHTPLSRRNPFIRRQVAAGGGIAATTLPPTQYPTVTYAASLYTLGTYTSATWKDFTQTFATTALGTWALGPTARAGTIGLGKIQGTVGTVKNNHKKAVQTSSPQV